MEDQDNEAFAPTKKRTKKEFIQVHPETLGFKRPELPVIDVSPRRVRKPNVVRSEADQLQRLFAFRSKFKLVVDASEVNEQQAKHFDGTCLNEWLLVQQVIFTASENLPIQCPICHNSKEEICAAKITPCGHVFCWPCMLRFLKLSSSSKCPVCMKHLNMEEMRSCKFYHYPAIVKDAQIKLVLRAKQSHSKILYDPVTREEDHAFSRLIRVEKEYIQEMLLEEQRQLEAYRESQRRQKEFQEELQMSKKGSSGANYKVTSTLGIDVYGDSAELATRALEMSIQRLSRVEYEMEQRRDKKKSQYIRSHMHYQFLPQGIPVQYLYQEEKGRQVFVHPILSKYLLEEYQRGCDLPLTIKGRVLYLESVNQDLRTIHRNNRQRIQLYKQITNVIQSTDGIFVEVELRNDLLSKSLEREFLKEMNEYKSELAEREMLQTNRHEELVNRRLAQQRQRQKKLLEEEPWPVDNEIKDLKTCDRELNFPSLGPSVSLVERKPENLEEPTLVKQMQSQPPLQTKTNADILQKVIEENLFPELSELKKEPKDRKNSDQGNGTRKKKKKKEQVDITSHMFQRDDDWD